MQIQQSNVKQLLENSSRILSGSIMMSSGRSDLCCGEFSSKVSQLDLVVVEGGEASGRLRETSLDYSRGKSKHFCKVDFYREFEAFGSFGS
jgi:hypothetical protein